MPLSRTTARLIFVEFADRNMHPGKQICDSFQILGNTILVTVFLLAMNQMELSLVHNQTENHHYNHIPFNLKAIRNLFSRV